ncbi:MAG: DUF2799 domain-containing protein [Boseongicola sp.]
MAVAALLGLAACATLSEDACREGDWSQVGFRDGTNGRSADFIDQHAKACSRYEIAVNQLKWEAGRQEGLKRYCTTSNVYREGANGRRLKSVCPIELQDRLEVANDRGLIWHDIGQDISSVEREIRSINRLLSTLAADDPSRGSLLSQRARLRLEILHLRTRRIRYR